MNFFKELFQFLFHKNHVLTKKIYALGAVIITTCFISICILGANGNGQTVYSHMNTEEEKITSEEIETTELETLTEENEDLTRSLISEPITIEFDKYRNYFASSDAKNNAEITVENMLEKKALMKMEEETIPLSTAENVEKVSFDPVIMEVEANREPIQLSETDYEVLLKIVEAEAGGEDEFLRTLIANVIINRMLNDYYPNTIEEVVFQNDGKTYQFSPIKDKRYYKVEVSKKTITAVQKALAGYDNSHGALAFVDPSNTSDKVMSWFNNNLDFVMSYGNVSFYSF